MKKFTLAYICTSVLLTAFFTGCGASAPPTSAQPVRTVAPDTTPPAPTPKLDGPVVTYAITPNDDSYIGWTGYGGIMGSMEGGFATFDGTLTVPEDGDLTQAAVTAAVAMDSIFSTSRVLTKKLKDEHFFEVCTYPTATFESTGIEKTEDGYNVRGTMTVRNKTFGVVLPVAMKPNDNGIVITSELTFNRYDWGIAYEGTGDNFIKDGVLLTLEIQAEAE